jgi:hypothetical protein
MKSFVAWIVVLALSTCSAACATSVSGSPEARRADGLVKLREPLFFRPVLENVTSLDPAKGQEGMLDNNGFTVTVGPPFLEAKYAEKVSASRGAEAADRVVEVSLIEPDRKAFREWAGEHSLQEVVATTAPNIPALGYVDLAALRHGTFVRLGDYFSDKDAAEVMKALAG